MTGTHVWVLSILDPDDRLMHTTVSQPSTEERAVADYRHALTMVGAAGDGETVTVARGGDILQAAVLSLEGRSPREAADVQEAAGILRGMGVDAVPSRRPS